MRRFRERLTTFLLAEKLGEKESGPLQARLSNFPHYAATGVKAQVFVPILFLTLACDRNNLNNIKMLWAGMTM
jgi:hypothetical protein